MARFLTLGDNVNAARSIFHGCLFSSDSLDTIGGLELRGAQTFFGESCQLGLADSVRVTLVTWLADPVRVSTVGGLAR